jgi:hypothetical protein
MATEKKWLDEHKDELVVLDNNKIKCLITQHELKLDRFDLIQAHWYAHMPHVFLFLMVGLLLCRAGKTFQKCLAKLGKAKLNQDLDLSKYAPYIVQNKFDASKVFCHTTKTTLNKDKTVIENHLKGRRFKFRLSQLSHGANIVVGEDEDNDTREADGTEDWPAFVLDSDDEGLLVDSDDQELDEEDEEQEDNQPHEEDEEHDEDHVASRPRTSARSCLSLSTPVVGSKLDTHGQQATKATSSSDSVVTHSQPVMAEAHPGGRKRPAPARETKTLSPKPKKVKVAAKFTPLTGRAGNTRSSVQAAVPANQAVSSRPESVPSAPAAQKKKRV